MSKNNIAVDTNVLLDDPKIIYKLINKYEKIIIPLTVLKELDKHKFNPDLSYSARDAIYSILNFKSEYPTKIHLSVTDEEVNSNDDLIIKSASMNNADIATKDLSMSVISESKDVDVKLYDVINSSIFEPYIYLSVEELPGTFDYQQSYIYDDFINKSLINKLSKEAWMFVFIKDSDKTVCLYATNPKNDMVYRIDNNPKYRESHVGGNKVKALDDYQVCAFYAMEEADSVLITGKWGTGKTLISSANTLQNSESKVFITRPPTGINHKYDIGYLPGDKENKMSGWFAGFMSALYYIYSNTRGQGVNKDNVHTQYDIVKDKYFNENFETVPINAIQGMSLLEGDAMIVDELQLIDIDYLSMILSRASADSKLILLGDLAQTYNVVRPSESGLLKLLRTLPHKSLAYVDLRVSYRNELVELADKLQDKTI